MSNNEIFDIILVNLSNKLIDKYLRKIVVIKYKNTNKYQYNINSNIFNLVRFLNELAINYISTFSNKVKYLFL